MGVHNQQSVACGVHVSRASMQRAMGRARGDVRERGSVHHEYLRAKSHCVACGWVHHSMGRMRVAVEH